MWSWLHRATALSPTSSLRTEIWIDPRVGETCGESDDDCAVMVGEQAEFEIVVAAGPDCGRTIPLTERRQTLGRSPTCGIRIEDPGLLPHHLMMSGRPPDLTIQALGGDVEILDGGFRVGATVCWVRPMTRPSSVEPGVTRLFHRPPPTIDVVEVERPVEPPLRVRPREATAPPWGPVLGGAATGLIVTVVTRQWLFAVFSMVTAVVAGITWSVHKIGSRRAQRRWAEESAADRATFDQRCAAYARHLARARRGRHRLLGDLLVAARHGDAALWSKRGIDDVCVGFGSRQVEVVPGASPLAFNDIPVTIDLSAGSILGVHGTRAESVVAAIVVRLAIEVGPSDWQLLTTTDLPEPWSDLRSLAHCRRNVLDRDDLQESDGSTRQDIVWVTEPMDVSQRRSLALRFLEGRKASMIVSASSLRDLPAHCTTIIDASSTELDGVSPLAVREVVEALGMWRDPDAASLALPAHVRLVDIDRYRSLSVEDIVRRWSERSTSVRIDLGMATDGVAHLDLTTDGPHAVVVGTTGAGKSELLRTLVMSLALNTSPAALNLVLVDYKGGSAFDACAELPHVVAVVTDLEGDGRENTTRRMLRGLEAELRRRETVLRTAGVGSQVEYQRLPASVRRPMARLVIVIDELAALRADVPDVVSSLVSVAQRGRSLGLHLIVATQRPGSELSGDIVTNASLRIALRLASREDSMQVLGYPTAAGLSRSRPGRAVMSIGGDSPEEFQTLRVGDELAHLVSLMDAAAENLALPPSRRPWCEALPAQLAPTPDAPPLAVGLVDDPDAQRQFPLLWDPRAHVLIAGGPGSGKTWALHTLLAVLRRFDPSARYFAIAGRGDRPAWIAVQDHERLYRLLRHVSSVIEARQRTRSDTSPLVMIVDDVDVWRSLYADDRLGVHLWDMFERIVARGPAVGVSCVLSTTSDNGLPGFIGARLAQHWIGADRPGSFRLRSAEGTGSLTAQLFDPRCFETDFDALVAGVDHSVTAVLPARVDATPYSEPGSFGVRASDLTEIRIRKSVPLRALVVGHRRSGRTVALQALSRAWRDCNPDGRILHLTSVSDDMNDELTDVIGTMPVLLVMDDADRFDTPSNLSRLLVRSLETPNAVSILAAASPHFVRTRTDHWLQRLRMHRCGVLLGRCADEDGDLLGHYDRSLAVVPERPGRGLWMEEGDPCGIVQFFSSAIGEEANRSTVRTD